MTNPYDNVTAIRKILPVVAAASEVCGYCGARRDWLEPEDHTWDSEPWKTEAICEHKHFQAIRDGFAERDDKDLAYAERWRQEDAADQATLQELHTHVAQLENRITELTAASKAQDRCIRVVIIGTVFAFAMLVFTVRMFWM